MPQTKGKALNVGRTGWGSKGEGQPVKSCPEIWSLDSDLEDGINPAVCGNALAGIDGGIAFEFNPSALNETSFSYNDFISSYSDYRTGSLKGPIGDI